LSATAPGQELRRPQARETAKILADCRDLAAHRLVLSFSAMLDRVGDLLMERANRALVREDTAVHLAARRALNSERAEIMGGFERRLREHIDKRITGEAASKADFSKVDATKLTLIDTAAMDESVLTGNIRRNIENFCHDELATLNRGMAYLLDRPGLETEGNPIAPGVIVEAFAAALREVQAEERAKLTILRELNQIALSDLNGIYADLNRHLANLHVVPAAVMLGGATRSAARARPKKSPRAGPDAVEAGPELDLMALFRQLQGGPAPMPGAALAPPPNVIPHRSNALRAEEANPFWMLGVSPPTDMGPVPGGVPPGAGRAMEPGADVRFLGSEPGGAMPFPPVDPDAGPARRSWPPGSSAKASRACRPASRASASATARSCASPASRRASTTSCATSRSHRSASA
jgi:hypothetical protein